MYIICHHNSLRCSNKTQMIYKLQITILCRMENKRLKQPINTFLLIYSM